MACEKWLDHYELWKEWRKNHRGPWLHEVLVLLGLAKSPMFELYRSKVYSWDGFDEELDEALNEIDRIYGEEE